MLQGCDCRCQWRGWLVDWGKYCNIWTGKQSFSAVPQKAESCQEAYSQRPTIPLGIALCGPKRSASGWGDASWVAVNRMQGLDRSVG